MDLDKTQVMSMMNCSMGDGFKIPVGDVSNWSSSAISSGGLDYSSIGSNITTLENKVYNVPNSISGWDYFQNYYYPLVVKESYPVYLQERAQDKGKQAFEILKVLQDKKLLNVGKVSDFIDAMDAVIKTL